LVVALLGATAVCAVWLAGQGHLGRHEGPGEIVAARRPAQAVRELEEKVAASATSLRVPEPKQILFGDLHVHTTFSFDAFLASLPIIGGEGAHPPADACDYARFCSQLDFWSINDHAEAITPRHWSETIDSIRQCNKVAGDPSDPDTVAFLGWEWTQVGTTPDDHYGHKNVVFRGLSDDEVPARPISSGGRALEARQRGPSVMRRGLFALLSRDERIRDFVTYAAERDDWPLCDASTPSPELPSTCFEMAETPTDLYRKLDEWGHESIVIPHGTTWGFYTPPGSEWAMQLADDLHDPERQTLLEVYSGHGDSELYRDWRGVTFDPDGVGLCPEPTSDYLPGCWQAGEIIRGRCLAEGASEPECESRAAVARANAANAGVAYHLTVPGATAEDWLDAGQCRDCDGPSFNYRPGGSAQYILAVGNFDDDAPRHFRMGFMSSSDNHKARPGTGFKETDRRGNTESGRRRARDQGGALARLFAPPEVEPVAESVAFDPETTELGGFQLVELERQASFFMTGGLIAVHAEGRDRRSLWEAMERREVYGTSGPRILLWFDLLNPPGSSGAALPMGSEVTLGTPPIFQARAAGSFEQLPGCPQVTTSGLPADKLERICHGECYHPSDHRRPITRIEVVRVRPQQHPDEPLVELVDDPWQRFDCQPDPDGCSVLFSDPDFVGAGRSAAYYVRAYEAPAPAINADGVRCERDESGGCVSVRLCGDDDADDCLGEHEPRAWSSPIWVDPISLHPRNGKQP
jgi:hypothetical protein